MPIMWFAIFDFEFKKNVLFKNPQYYSLGIENKAFTPMKFWAWVFYGIVSSIGIYLVAFYPFAG